METVKTKKQNFWNWAISAVIFRICLICFLPKNLNLSSLPQVSTPLTSIRRLAEAYWLKQSAISPYAGSMYHGSPLLLSLLGPLTVKRVNALGIPNHILCGLLFVIADLVSAIVIRATGKRLQMVYIQSLRSLDLVKQLGSSEILSSGDIAALVYLWNPYTILACIGLSTSPVENLVIVVALYGACARVVPLAAFGWVLATHLALYPAVLIIPIVLLLGYGPDAPPKKLFPRKSSYTQPNSPTDSPCEMMNLPSPPVTFSWISVKHFLFWALVWAGYILVLCGLSVKQFGGLQEMFKSTYGFILSVEDLSPNIGVLWYFFAEVFDFFRGFFLIVIHVNILAMILPLAMRLNHRPCFLAFVYIAISSMLKSYPSVGDAALYLSLLGLFVNQLAEMKSSFFLFCGYVGVSLLSPVMHNLWIWRGTGNANFYYATAVTYLCFQGHHLLFVCSNDYTAADFGFPYRTIMLCCLASILSLYFSYSASQFNPILHKLCKLMKKTILVIDSVSAVLNHDRLIRKLSAK